MAIKLLIKKVLLPGVPARAYQLVLTDEEIFILHLGKDWKGFGASAGGGVEGLIAGAILNAKGKTSERKIAEKIGDLDYSELESAVESDKRSVRIAYKDVKKLATKPKSVMSGEAFFQIKSRPGNYKFRLFEEEERQGLVDFFREVRPELMD